MKSYENFYTSVEQAKVENRNRWADSGLKNRVREFLGGEIPAPFQHQPRAALSRNIISPQLEFLRFCQIAKDLELAPLGLEGVNDNFVTNNKDKMLLVKLRFLMSYDKNGKVVSETRLIVDPNTSQKQPFSSIDTLWGENLVKFHHRLLQKFQPFPVELFDDFQWFAARGMKESIKEYYIKFLALFVAHGVLFENFIEAGYKAEERFTREVFRPALQAVTEEFGVMPIIVPSVPVVEVMDIKWWCYPKIVIDDIPKKQSVPFRG